MVMIGTFVDDQQLWMETFGSGFEGQSHWIQQIGFAKGDWKTVGEAVIVAEDAEVDDVVIVHITIEDLAKALSKIVGEGRKHCGTYPIDATLDDWDACVGDMVLQYVVYGRLVW